LINENAISAPTDLRGISSTDCVTIMKTLAGIVGRKVTPITLTRLFIRNVVRRIGLGGDDYLEYSTPAN
jgi:hypothetical protein